MDKKKYDLGDIHVRVRVDAMGFIVITVVMFPLPMSLMSCLLSFITGNRGNQESQEIEITHTATIQPKWLFKGYQNCKFNLILRILIPLDIIFNLGYM